MANETWRVNGLKDLEKALTELGAATGVKVLRKAGRDAMSGVQMAMMMGAGVDPESEGEHMRDSIKITTKKMDRKGGSNNAVAIRVGPTKKHSQKAIAQEYGTEKQTADPFMRPALYENRHRVVDDFTTNLTVAIAKAVRKQRRANR
ncbi:HK97-gp10 family putative phage morphogenesis protein [Photobacterium leiognathi]|uniref:HK97-gp10 family putative phage morphogenesis protein n=1 Tax=Photobacterium leiognathi TaxID=553611 RepID=UPI000D176E28|nr:HK97-gp10 family putative phage morphogenesis protein [Photobacterium leiognathi]PSW53021.1 hypothetical protein C0W50_19630 [Photobacterium leiognathi subsp. mandapamensis]